MQTEANLTATDNWGANTSSKTPAAHSRGVTDSIAHDAGLGWRTGVIARR